MALFPTCIVAIRNMIITGSLLQFRFISSPFNCYRRSPIRRAFTR